MVGFRGLITLGRSKTLLLQGPLQMEPTHQIGFIAAYLPKAIGCIYPRAKVAQALDYERKTY